MIETLYEQVIAREKYEKRIAAAGYTLGVNRTQAKPSTPRKKKATTATKLRKK